MKQIRCALPKGRLQEALLKTLGDIDIHFVQPTERNYTLSSNIPGITGKLLKPRAIPQLVAMGNYDFGFCGLDLVQELDSDEVISLYDLKLNTVKLVIANKPGFFENLPKRPIVIATEYEKIASRWATSKGLAHIILQTWGSTEAYVPDDADVVLDTTETGETLFQNGLMITELLMESSTYLIVNKKAYESSVFRLTMDGIAFRLRLQKRHGNHGHRFTL